MGMCSKIPHFVYKIIIHTDTSFTGAKTHASAKSLYSAGLVEKGTHNVQHEEIPRRRAEGRWSYISGSRDLRDMMGMKI